jgi:hypothetical protein
MQAIKACIFFTQEIYKSKMKKKLEFIWQPWKRYENLLVSWADFTAVLACGFWG